MTNFHDLPTRDDLLGEIDTFLARTKMSDDQFGRLSCKKNHRLLERVRCGGDFRLSTVHRILEFIESYEDKGPPKGFPDDGFAFPDIEPAPPTRAIGPDLPKSLENDLQASLVEWREVCARKHELEEQIATITDLLHA